MVKTLIVTLIVGYSLILTSKFSLLGSPEITPSGNLFYFSLILIIVLSLLFTRSVWQYYKENKIHELKNIRNKKFEDLMKKSNAKKQIDLTKTGFEKFTIKTDIYYDKEKSIIILKTSNIYNDSKYVPDGFVLENANKLKYISYILRSYLSGLLHYNHLYISLIFLAECCFVIWSVYTLIP